MPTRLIDVGEPEGEKYARLVITRTSEIQAPYLALSYCWGKSMQSNICLRDENLAELQSYINEEQLARTHRDVFQLARDLGFRYVWIDALCIVQGNSEDWAYESKTMAQVYGNAALTIIAGRAADSGEGFLENRLRPVVGPCAIPFNNTFYYQGTKKVWGESKTGAMGNIWVSLPRSGKDGPVSQRGWCFQELMLSSRALVFGEEQLHFQCQELRIQEDGRVQRSIPYRVQHAYDAKYAPLNPGPKPSEAIKNVPRSPGPDDEEQTRRWLIFWYDAVLWQYTSKQLTNPTDIFAALSGLAQIVKAKVCSRYLGGLWEVDMVRGLLWQPTHVKHFVGLPFMCERRMAVVPSSQCDSNMQTEAVPVEVPSWSWAAIQGQVSLDWVNRREADYHESAWQVRPKYQGQWTQDTACQAAVVHIPRCELEFFGRPRRARCSPYPHGRELNMKDKDKEKQARRRRTAMVVLMPFSENEPGQGAVTDCGSEDSNRVIADGWFDVAEEVSSTCWCLPLTKKRGLMLIRDEQNKFRRVGTVNVRDLEWMLSVEEEVVCLI
ncbi:hypothetical protein NUW58_g6627 [Xylaria curta]|uniref:Uncharacterized protein n=1 Tax=Xylaria curta TaxID=42375 RepID=A0ACC1NRI4_9PEZI|nr:hypothetical protein NUW58_g6627 [Xylaria curta]